jgi:DNA-binding IclR family transcriptional regulator
MATPTTDSTAPTAMKSLRSALRLLTEFTSGQPRYTVTELATKTGLTMSHTSKIVAALCDAGLVTRDPGSQTFSIAVKSFVLGSQFFNHDQLSREALGVLRRLTEETRHSTRLSVLDGERVVYLIGVSGPLFLDSPWRMGTYLRMHSTSAGRVFLAFMDEAIATRLMRELPLEAMTESTVTDRDEFQKLIVQVRQQGFAVSRGENTPNLAAIGVPVFDAARRVVGVLSVTFPCHMVAKEEEPTLLVPLMRAASTLSQRLGCPVYPFGSLA